MTTTAPAPLHRQRFYFIGEVAQELRRSEASVRFLISSGQLSSVKQGGRRVVTHEQLEAFITGDDSA